MGAYTVYRALAVAASNLADEHKPDLTNTAPLYKIGPHPSWSKIVSLDPWGAEVCRVCIIFPSGRNNDDQLVKDYVVPACMQYTAFDLLFPL